jgi:hypothetical protein
MSNLSEIPTWHALEMTHKKKIIWVLIPLLAMLYYLLGLFSSGNRRINNSPREILLLLLFILTANGILPGGSGTTIRHSTQIIHIAQNNTPHRKQNTAHKTTQTIKDTLHIMNTMQIQLQLQLNKLII